MKAQVLEAFGGPENFRLRDWPDPEPGAGEVLVEVAATSLNPAEYKIRSKGPAHAPELPAILGFDVAGTVRALGAGVDAFAVGDEVYGCVGGLRGVPGTHAQWVACDARLLARKPRSLDMRHAAALPLVAITAWEGLFDRADLQPGERVLVHGGCGGVGHLALQLAVWRGARVDTTVSSPQKAEIARSLGASATIDCNAESVEAYVERLTDGRGYDLVFDATGGSDLGRSFAAARLNGRVVTIVSQYTADLTPMHRKGLSLHVVFMLIPLLDGIGRGRHGEILHKVADLVDAGGLRPLVDPRRFGLEDLPDAHRHLESGQAVGKVVIDVSV